MQKFQKLILVIILLLLFVTAAAAQTNLIQKSVGSLDANHVFAASTNYSGCEFLAYRDKDLGTNGPVFIYCPPEIVSVKAVPRSRRDPHDVVKFMVRKGRQNFVISLQMPGEFAYQWIRREPIVLKPLVVAGNQSQK